MIDTSSRIARVFVSAGLVALAGAGLSASPRSHVILVDVSGGRAVMDVVGEVNNLAAAPDAPLGSSEQFGYVSNLEGVDSIFSDANPANQNETTALLTFVTEVKTVRVTPHGPFSIVIREGTTTFYRNSLPASFSSADSFRSGEAVLTSSIRQQVIVDTVAKTFTVVNVNTIADTMPFEINGDIVRIGGRGDVIRTSLVGVLRVRDGTPPPTGHFAGSAVGVGNSSDSQ